MADQVIEQLKAEGMSAETVADVQPLLANVNFRQDAEYQIATAQNAARAAALARSTTDDYVGTIGLFASIMSSARTLAKKFPEVSAEMKQVAASATAAMGKAKNNPEVATADAATGMPVYTPPPKPAATPTPTSTYMPPTPTPYIAPKP